MTDTVAQVRRHLADIPELIVEASHYLTPGTAPKDPDARHGTTIYRIPIVAEIADLLDERERLDDVSDNRKYAGFERAEAEDFHINNGQRRLGVLPTLGMWVSLAYVELDDLGYQPRECCGSRQHTVAGECNWLSEYAEPILELHPDFLRDIEQLWSELRKACRIRHQYTPKCPACGHRIEGVYGNTDDAAPAWWRCTGCPKTWVHDAEIARLATTQPPMTLHQMAEFLGLPLRDLYRWANSNRFVAVGRNKRGGALYEVEQVRRAAERLGKQPQSA